MSLVLTDSRYQRVAVVQIALVDDNAFAKPVLVVALKAYLQPTQEAWGDRLLEIQPSDHCLAATDLGDGLASVGRFDCVDRLQLLAVDNESGDELL